MNLVTVIQSFNGEIQSGGINWKWAHFPTKENAQSFDTWCQSHNFETRGVYPPTESDPTFGVRFR